MRNEDVKISQGEIQKRAQALGIDCEVYDQDGFTLRDNGRSYQWTNGELLGQVEQHEEFRSLPPPTLKDHITDFLARFW